MTQHAPIQFIRMNGLGNVFAVLDKRGQNFTIGDAEAKTIAEPEQGVGCDQIIILEPSQKADIFMRIRNADGGEVDACGNAARCVALLMAEEKGSADSSIETNVAIMQAHVENAGLVTIDMGVPKLNWDQIPLAEQFHDTRMIELQVGPIDDPVLHSPSAVNVGNPHCIFWVDDLNAHDLAAIGPIIEHHPLFPERANITLAQVTGEDDITIKVWERGVGLTQACGTAACAVGVAAARKRLTGRDVRVHLPGGTLNIVWRTEDDHILMSGPASLDYTGTLDGEKFTLLETIA